eukprot:1059879-Alexandrium_andersonii.AAC.1
MARSRLRRSPPLPSARRGDWVESAWAFALLLGGHPPVGQARLGGRPRRRRCRGARCSVRAGPGH